MSIPRRLEPELLDQLPADDPRAMRSRHDLKRVNALMGNVGAMASMLKIHAAGREPRTILDLGSGDGQLMLKVARRLAPRWRNVRVILLDRQNIVSEATRKSFAALQWRAEPISADVFEFLAAAQPGSVDVVSANLFLHHFTDEQLAGLFAKAAGLAWLLLACEPPRTKLVIELSRLLWALGCNDVTIHDAIASARAGFAGSELSALWPNRGQWELHEPASALLNHCFSARRRNGN
jgi:SAM-dependent methyltransferase